MEVLFSVTQIPMFIFYNTRHILVPDQQCDISEYGRYCDLRDLWEDASRPFIA